MIWGSHITYVVAWLRHEVLIVVLPVIKELYFDSLVLIAAVQEKADYGALIQELGGVYLESDHFIPDCTHLVVGEGDNTCVIVMLDPMWSA